MLLPAFNYFIKKKKEKEETYHCNWVERILNWQQKNFISTRWIVSVPWPSNPLTSWVVEKSLLSSNVYRLIRCKCYAFLCAFYILKLHKSLALKWHHHDITGERNITVSFPIRLLKTNPKFHKSHMFLSKQYLTRTKRKVGLPAHTSQTWSTHF